MLLCQLGLGALSVSDAAAQGFCTVAASAKRAQADHPHVKRTLEIWSKVQAPFAAMTGRQTGLVILDESAKNGAEAEAPAFKPAGVTCPGAPPVVYVTWPLIELVYGKKQYPEDFLAFVLGHELGHRINDLTVGGSIAGDGERRGGSGEHMEALADKRAAFFTSLAGFSTSKLASADIVTQFLEAEYRSIPRAILAQRKAALESTLKSFEAYEQLYEAGVALAFLQEKEAAERLLALADELIEDKTIPLPELKVLRAYVLMNNAAPDSPWVAPRASLLPGIESLRCLPIFAAHTALAEDAQAGALRGAQDLDERQKAALQRLKLASKLLDQAEEYQGSGFVLHNARACLRHYLGEPEGALKELKQAQALMTKETPKVVKEAIKQNQALMELGAYLAKHEPVPRSQGADAKAWGKKMLKQSKKLKGADAKLVQTMARWKRYPEIEPEPQPAAAPACLADAKATPPAALNLPETTEHALGACPAGWTLAHTLPATPSSASAQVTQLGITTCTMQGAEGAKRRFVRVRLPGSMSPALPNVHLTMVFELVPEAKRQPQQAWTCGGVSAQRQGVADDGQSLILSVNPARGLMPGLLWVDERGKVTRAVTLNSSIEEAQP